MTDFGDRSRRGPARSTVGWLLLAVAIVIAWSLLNLRQNAGDYGALAGHDGWPEIAGMVIGGSVAVTLVVWAGLFFCFVKDRAPGRGGVHFAILFATAIAAQAVPVFFLEQGSRTEREQERIAAASLADTMDAVIASDGKATVDTRAHATGDAGVVEQATRRLLAEMTANNRTFETELKALDYEKVLDPAGLAADRSMRRTRATIARARAAIEAHKARQTAAVASFDRAINTSTLSDDDKRRTLADFKRGQASGLQDAERMWAISADANTEMDQAAAALQASPRGWQIQRGVLAFSDQRAMDAYNGHIRRLQTLQGELRALDAASRTRGRDAASELRRGSAAP